MPGCKRCTLYGSATDVAEEEVTKTC